MDTHIEFKRKIDNARNILVGAVPSPAGQIDQITYALIYKFMSDIDDKSARLPGGTRQYFVNEYEKYDWHNLMRLDGQDKLNRYRDALSAMSKNEHLPEIFRSIYQNAFLPYNDPRTLNLFLKEVDGFVHTKSDAIGDAYEYLLSITGAQGDVGQFRTPRHIIKFIVDVVQPDKGDTVLDPACGTAGFLIAAYNYVRMQHDGVDEDGNQNGEQRLTADERKKLHGNYYGFDIDPTMVRTATVNMYLHGFSTPNIEIHDTLTSEEHWQNRYDVILANPPFMTPKGGIQPHGKFGVKANRAEVLFVDYIASHLKPNGRAGIIVPEGIIFQSGTAYKELRKSLVENSLYAVISLPSGVFNPYAGVKTSILLLDKELAAKKDEILFVKIENDGYSLGAQRRKMAGDQFPEALEVIERFKNGEELQTEFAHAVPRQQIAESGDYNLSGDRYKLVSGNIHADFPTFSLEELEKEGKVKFFRGSSLSKKDLVPDGKNKCIHYGELYTIYDPIIKNVVSRTNIESKTTSQKGDVLVPATTTAGPDGIAVARSLNEDGVVIGGDINVIRTGNKYILSDYLSWAINYPLKKTLSTYATGVNIYHLSNNDLRKLNVIIPPIEIQREIVAELDGYQKIIDAAQTIVKTYKPTIKINPEWDTKLVSEISERVTKGTTPTTAGFQYKDSGVNFVKVESITESGDFIPTKFAYVDNECHRALKRSQLKEGDVLFSIAGALGRVAQVDSTILPANTNQALSIITPTQDVLPNYLAHVLKSDLIAKTLDGLKVGVAQSNLSLAQVSSFKIPLPPIEIQREIVAELEAEQQLINANKKLIEIYQQKIKSKIAEVWGE